MKSELRRLLKIASNDDDVRAIVITGAELACRKENIGQFDINRISLLSNRRRLTHNLSIGIIGLSSSLARVAAQ
jgi:hypothetical protein